MLLSSNSCLRFINCYDAILISTTFILRQFVLQKVIWGSTGDMGFASSRRRVELKERIFHMLIHFHNRRLVSTSIAVIGSTENSHHVFIMRPIISFHHQLMRSGDKCKAIIVIKRF